MTTIKNQKIALVAIVAIAAVIAVSTIAIGSVRAADTITTTITKHTNNTGVNVQTDTNQKQDCVTAGGYSGISGGDDGFHWGYGDDRQSHGSCTADSNDKVDQSGGILKK